MTGNENQCAMEFLGADSKDTLFDTNNAGGKAATLHTLKNLGYPVPNGLVILTHSFNRAVKQATQAIPDLEKRLASAYVSPESLGCQSFCSEMNLFFKTYSLPWEEEQVLKNRLADIGNATSLAIRSSATAEDSTTCSWAGQFKTFLRVENTLSPVAQAIKSVWASVFTPRVFAYAKHMRIPPQKLRMAVLVQELLEEPDFSGVLFTRAPSGDANQMYLEFVEGYGESLVSGTVTPRSRSLPRQLHAAGQNIDGLQSKWVLDIHRIGLSIEEALGCAQDIEWTIRDSSIFVLQARPITGTNKQSVRVAKEHANRVLVTGLPASSGRGCGDAALVFNIDDAASLREDEVIVAPMTNPDMVAYMGRAAAIVTDVGGMICHTAIVSREMGIPCVVGTGTATREISTGVTVTVDGDTGEVLLGHLSPITESPSHRDYITQLEERAALLEKKALVNESLLDSVLDWRERGRFFGHEPEVVSMPYPYPPRKGPWWPENWPSGWTSPSCRETKWANIRPEIVNTPLTKSLIVQGVETIPYVFDMDDIGPLFTRWRRCRIHIPIDVLDQVRTRVADRWMNDATEFRRYLDELHGTYREWDNRTADVAKKIGTKRSFYELIEWFGFLWEVHERFFALCFLIQTIGDDIVWPVIRRICSTICKKAEIEEHERAANSIVKILASPARPTMSAKYLDSLEHLSRLWFQKRDKPTSQSVTAWENAVEQQIADWGWMRDRDLYYSPLSTPQDIERILSGFEHARGRHADPNVWSRTLLTLTKCLPAGRGRDRLYNIVELGVTLHVEREDHHVIWVRNVDTMRRIVLQLAENLTANGLLQQAEDVFFLQIPELFALCSQRSPNHAPLQLLENRKIAFFAESKHRCESNHDTEILREEDYY